MRARTSLPARSAARRSRDDDRGSGHRWLTTLAAAALLTACSRREATEPPPAPDGAQVYRMACARCHGPTGRGDGELAARIGGDLNLRNAPDAEGIVAVVTEGRGAMPPHRGRLSAAQIAAVATYVAALTGQ